MAQTHHFHSMVFIHISRKHVHEAVVARYHVLQNYLIWVTRTVNLCKNGGGLFRSVGRIHFFHAAERVLPVQNAGRGLYNNGVSEAQRLRRKRPGVFRPGHADGFGVGDGIFVAQLVKICLRDEPVAQSGPDIRRYTVFWKSFLYFHQKAGIIVRAAQHHTGFFCVGVCKVRHRARKHGGLVHIFNIGAMYNFGIHGVAHGPAAEGIAFYAICLMKGARHGIAVHVRADKHGKDGRRSHNTNLISGPLPRREG